MIKNNIKLLRKKRKISQKDLANALNVTRQTIVAVENNYYYPSLELSLKLAKYFNEPVEAIFTLHENITD
ncbi:DNA-binding protein [Bacillus safensis FO-36b]|uniref:helix-turn-helix transcriptional regulator n=1 Tax=Bacillus TaxID=1386 RepID=UPI00045C9000|nr:helix-turn-helix transcriptional regulator [Bacillus safensis]AWI35380.1 hypothetical protein RS87_01280 [Bacillus safensis FO-36b]KDE26385.1 DNA-binding protein [Bacillus safensis FO-36b]KKD40676.1 hypothetical protein KU48_15000 [Bacillus safensis]MCM3050060.1 helix-turn-helix transcriptional regulator [Bacillus safensis]MCM3451614.1 helix-turn-helix transcriptional regulator [Bacillus safensis]